MRWVEWNRYFQGHPPSRVRGESVAAAATLLSVAITSSLARVVQPGLGAGRLTFLANPATALSTLLPASWSIKSYCLPTQAIIDEPPLTLVLNACPRLRSSHLPPSRALGFCHTAKSTIHLPLPISSLRRIQLSSEPRSFAVRCTASHWSLVHTHDSPDAVPRSLAINRPITRGFLANPRELLATTSLYPRQKYWPLCSTTSSRTSNVLQFWRDCAPLQTRYTAPCLPWCRGICSVLRAYSTQRDDQRGQCCLPAGIST